MKNYERSWSERFDRLDVTILTLLVQHTSKEHRDAHISSGMEPGFQEAMDLLEQVAVSLR